MHAHTRSHVHIDAVSGSGRKGLEDGLHECTYKMHTLSTKQNISIKPDTIRFLGRVIIGFCVHAALLLRLEADSRVVLRWRRNQEARWFDTREVQQPFPLVDPAVVNGYLTPYKVEEGKAAREGRRASRKVRCLTPLHNDLKMLGDDIYLFLKKILLM